MIPAFASCCNSGSSVSWTIRIADRLTFSATRSATAAGAPPSGLGIPRPESSHSSLSSAAGDVLIKAKTLTLSALAQLLVGRRSGLLPGGRQDTDIKGCRYRGQRCSDRYYAGLPDLLRRRYPPS